MLTYLSTSHIYLLFVCSFVCFFGGEISLKSAHLAVNMQINIVNCYIICTLRSLELFILHNWNFLDQHFICTPKQPPATTHSLLLDSSSRFNTIVRCSICLPVCFFTQEKLWAKFHHLSQWAGNNLSVCQPMNRWKNAVYIPNKIAHSQYLWNMYSCYISNKYLAVLSKSMGSHKNC